MIAEGDIYYHIHTKGKGDDSLWYEGSIFQIGEERNPFLAYYDTARIGVHFEEGKTIPMLKCFDIYRQIPGLRTPENLKTLLEQAEKAIKEMAQYTREFIFEEVRREKFSDLPSRMRGIWLTKKENIDYWISKMHSGEKDIYEVKVLGKIHIGSNLYLKADTLSHSEFRKNAEDYWSGKSIEDSEHNEILFEGKIEVIERVNAS